MEDDTHDVEKEIDEIKERLALYEFLKTIDQDKPFTVEDMIDAVNKGANPEVAKSLRREQIMKDTRPVGFFERIKRWWDGLEN